MSEYADCGMCDNGANPNGCDSCGRPTGQQLGTVKVLSGKRLPAMRTPGGAVTILATGRSPVSVRVRDSFRPNN